MASAALSVTRRLARDRRELHPIERRVYPIGFVRAGGLRLPVKERREALAEIEEATRGMDAATAFTTIQRIVADKWDAVALQPSDTTQLSYGKSTVPTYEDPCARQKARRMLLSIPMIPQFAGLLSTDEARVWTMSFDGGNATQETIAAAGGMTQGTVSKTLRRAVRKLNSRYRELRDRDELPIEVAAWVRQMAEDDARHYDLDLADAVARLRKRSYMLQAQKEDVGQIAASTKGMKTGDRDLDGLSIRNA